MKLWICPKCLDIFVPEEKFEHLRLHKIKTSNSCSICRAELPLFRLFSKNYCSECYQTKIRISKNLEVDA